MIVKKGVEKWTEGRERQRWRKKYDGGGVGERQGEGGRLQEGERGRERAMAK